MVHNIQGYPVWIGFLDYCTNYIRFKVSRVILYANPELDNR